MKTIKIFFFCLVTVFVYGNTSCQVADSNAVTNEQFRQIAAGKNVVILDVRTVDEFIAGHIPNSKNIDILQTDAFKQYIAGLPKDKTYLLYCRSGKRSATALNLMKENGFVDVKHLQKGISGWDGELEK